MVYKKIATIDDLWDGEMKSFVVEGQKILLIHLGDQIYAYEDRCAHQSVELSKGKLEGRVLTCPVHEWQYDVCTGRGVNPSGTCLRSFRVVVKEKEIFVDLSSQMIRVANSNRCVGPVLSSGTVTEAIVAAIQEENRDMRIENQDSYVCISVPDRCVVSRLTIVKYLGRSFILPGDLETLMLSSRGRLTVSEDQVAWSSAAEVTKEEVS